MRQKFVELSQSSVSGGASPLWHALAPCPQSVSLSIATSTREHDRPRQTRHASQAKSRQDIILPVSSSLALHFTLPCVNSSILCPLAPFLPLPRPVDRHP